MLRSIIMVEIVLAYSIYIITERKLKAKVTEWGK